MKKLILVVAFFLVAGQQASANEAAIEAAQKAASPWLSLTDNRQFEKSWSTASSLFRAAVSTEDWEQSLGAARKPFGNLASRRLDSATFYTTLPGAPDGEYVVMIFNSSFEHKKAAVETVTVMKDQDDTWRVSGYYIR